MMTSIDRAGLGRGAGEACRQHHFLSARDNSRGQNECVRLAIYVSESSFSL